MSSPPRRKRGCRKPLTAEQQELAEHYVPMSRSLAKSYKKTWPDLWEELDSAAMLAIVEAAESYDATRNVRFSTFARIRVLGALRDVVRREARIATRHPIASPDLGERIVVRSSRRQRDMVRDDGERDLPLSLGAHNQEMHGSVVNTTPDPPTGMELEQADDINAWLRKLPTQHADACRQIYINGCNQVEAARRMGLSQSRLSYIHREAIAMLNGSWDEHVRAES